MGWGSKPATKFHTLEKAVLERDKNTNMRRQNRYRFSTSSVLWRCLVWYWRECVWYIRNGSEMADPESRRRVKLKGQSGETDQNTGMVENQRIRVALMTSGYSNT